MNKLFSKIAALSVGLAMAIGVGVAVGSKEVREAKADSATITASQFTAVGTASSIDQTVSNVRFQISNGLINSTQVRIYKSQTLTIHAPANNNLTSVAMTCTASGTSQYGPGCFTSIDGYSYSENVGTWTGSAASISLTASSNQVRVTQFVIEYSSSSTGEPAIGLSKSSLSFINGDDGETISVVPNEEFTATPVVTVSEASYVDVAINGLELTVSPKAVGTEKLTVTATNNTEVATAELSVEVKDRHGRVADDPFTVVEAIAAIDAGIPSTDKVYVSGIISQIDTTESQFSGQICYWISDDGTTDNQFEIYWGKAVGNVNFTSLNDIELGASVVNYGGIKKYNTTYEFDSGSYLYSYAAPVKTLTEITLSGEYPTSFEVGDTFSHEGLVVTAHYSTTATADVTSSATFSSPDMSTIGEKTVTVSYTEDNVKKEAEYTINVTAVSVKYTVTYSSGEHGSGSYAHENNPAGSYTLLAFTSLEGISPEEGYRFKSYTVSGVEKNPGEIIEISGATAVTVNFEEKPLEVTFDFIQMASDKGWENGVAYTENTISPITVSALGGGNNGKWYSSGNGSWRVYSGGTVEITASSGYSVESVTSSPECEFTISGGKATFAPSARTDFTSIVVTYSQSGTITYTVEYNANGGSGTMVDSNSPYESGALVTVLENSFTREDYTFVEWNTAADGSGQSYEAGDTFNASANTVLYAQWKENGSSTVATRSYTLVEDATKLTAGAKYIIAASADNGVALSTTQNNNNRGEEEVAISGKTATVSTNKVQVISLEAGANSEQWALNVGEGYLYAASSSSNQLKTRTENSDANSEWKFEFGEGGVVTITAQGTNSRKVMQYNVSNGIFACYATASQGALYLYRLDFEATLLNNVTCDGAGSHTLPEGYTWGDLKAVYQDLPSSEQSALKSATAKAGSGLERYDYLVAKYSSYENFIERTITPILNGRTFDSEFATNNTAIIVIVIAAASALAFTTLLVFKKKRQK